jgi:hypothetical protein
MAVRAVKMPEAFDVFVDLADFRTCVQRWRFSGTGTTVVSLNAGTTGDLLREWKISVSSASGA